MPAYFKRVVLIALSSSLLVLALTGCGNKDDRKVATQVAARVGSEEISVHQINQVLSRTNTAGVTPGAADAMRREVLEKLIDQQIAVQQATANKLDRTPEVVSQMEAARSEVLARAYVQQVVGALPKPSPDEIGKYYVEHPQLFAQRRVFQLQEIRVPAAAVPAVAEQLRSQIAAGKSMEEMANWLKSKDVKFGGGSATRAAEQIPLDLLAKVHALKDGQTTLVEGTQGLTVVRVAASQLAAVTQADALPRIEQFLSNRRGVETLAKNIQELRAKSSITYMGDFAQAAGSAATPGPGQPATQSATAALPAGVATAAASAASARDLAARTAIEKGLAGLK